jgi:hypothetical protein
MLNPAKTLPADKGNHHAEIIFSGTAADGSESEFIARAVNMRRTVAHHLPAAGRRSPP